MNLPVKIRLQPLDSAAVFLYSEKFAVAYVRIGVMHGKINIIAVYITIIPEYAFPGFVYVSFLV